MLRAVLLWIISAPLIGAELITMYSLAENEKCFDWVFDKKDAGYVGSFAATELHEGICSQSGFAKDLGGREILRIPFVKDSVIRTSWGTSTWDMVKLKAEAFLAKPILFGGSPHPVSQRGTRRHASAADIEALSARLGDAAVLESMFSVDGEPRQFLRREQFIEALVKASGPPLSEDAAYECWLEFGGAERPAEKKKEDKGFFGNFMANIAENAAGTKDTREKDQWGNPLEGMTIIDQAVIKSEQKAILESMASS